jgi:Na+/H+ antiporter NhaA
MIMAFAASRTLVLGIGVAVPLPVVVDVGGSTPPSTLYTHARVPGGTTYTLDTGQAWVVPATTDTVFAIPTGAMFITATAASTVQLGRLT